MRRTRRQKRSFRRVKWLAFFLLLFVGIGLVWGFGGLHGRGSRGGAPGLMAGEHTVHVMILGVDQRADDVGRSDTLMVATLDTESGKGALLSVPRDTRLAIDGHGYDKANHAYAFGGHALSMSAVENLLGVPMDHYLIINTRAFERIIDAIGGVDINVEKRMHYEDPWDDNGGLVIDLKPGMQHMNGKTAVTYVRYRDEEGDIGRIKRQQKFMKACMDKVTSPAIIPKLPTVIKEVIGSVKTDLSFRQLLEFAGTLKEAQKNGLKTEMVPRDARHPALPVRAPQARTGRTGIRALHPCERHRSSRLRPQHRQRQEQRAKERQERDQALTGNDEEQHLLTRPHDGGQQQRRHRRAQRGHADEPAAKRHSCRKR